MTKVRFLVLFLINIELRRLPDPLDNSKVNNSIANVNVGLPSKRISFCSKPSSIKMNPIPRAANYGIILAKWRTLPTLFRFFIQRNGIIRNAITITMLQLSKFCIISGNGFS